MIDWGGGVVALTVYVLGSALHVNKSHASKLSECTGAEPWK